MRTMQNRDQQYGIKVPEWIRRHGDRLRIVSGDNPAPPDEAPRSE